MLWDVNPRRKRFSTDSWAEAAPTKARAVIVDLYMLKNCSGLGKLVEKLNLLVAWEDEVGLPTNNSPLYSSLLETKFHEAGSSCSARKQLHEI